VSQIEIARAIATIAHRGQVDKAGNPYIDHPNRVAASLSNEHNNTIAAAWLHDVIEDSFITAEDLLAAGVHPEVVGNVELLTRRKDVRPDEYYADITQSYAAKKVKLADIADNTNLARLVLLDDSTVVRLIHKYAKAKVMLGVSA
jgi:(p)ppGpp synthase/HD superfamily hydrolase